MKSEIAELLSFRSSIVRQIAEAKEHGDVLGAMQFEERMRDLDEEIGNRRESKTAPTSVSLMFSGQPVFGTHGILAAFSGAAVEKFQDLISREFAAESRDELGARGRIPNQNASGFMITEMARGSVGFVLEEVAPQHDLDESPLACALVRSLELLDKVSSSNDDDFEEALQDIDYRVLIGLREFFVHLDKSAATIRLVNREYSLILNESAISRGRSRTEATSIAEEPKKVTGVLSGLLPDRLRFEFVANTGENLHGSTTRKAADRYTAQIKLGLPIAGVEIEISVIEKTTELVGSEPKKVYQLVDFISIDIATDES